MKAKFPEEDGNSVQEAAAGARLTSVTEPAEGSGLTWRPEAECNAQVAVQAINSHNALPVAGSDGLRLSHLQSIIRTQFGQYDFGAGIGVFWWRIVDEPDAFPPEIWELFLQSNRPRDGLEAPSCGRDCMRVETAHRGAQSRGKAARGWGVGRGGARSVTRPNTPIGSSQQTSLTRSTRLYGSP